MSGDASLETEDIFGILHGAQEAFGVHGAWKSRRKYVVFYELMGAMGIFGVIKKWRVGKKDKGNG